ncbi:hypothetical protein ANN_21412 [Periplaneta americana]|uniref:Uncharacterized protein n=1 Tax=Periplaneta americana TaxID=6978 RepID=A0ABQ8SFN8_PERAM|nr:hypothetical protein ANN_21412 [Periplaneta americana]
MAGLCEGGNEPPGSLEVFFSHYFTFSHTPKRPEVAYNPGVRVPMSVYYFQGTLCQVVRTLVAKVFRILSLIITMKEQLHFVIGTHCCERVILVSVQSAASASATEIKDSRMQLRRATSAVHKRAAKCTQEDGDFF